MILHYCCSSSTLNIYDGIMDYPGNLNTQDDYDSLKEKLAFDLKVSSLKITSLTIISN